MAKKLFTCGYCGTFCQIPIKIRLMECYECGKFTNLREVEFIELTREISKDTQFHSSAKPGYEHPLNQEILSWGNEAVEFILHYLERGVKNNWDPFDDYTPWVWFCNLPKLTNKNPVPIEYHGRLDLVANAWVQWGKHNGIKYHEIYNTREDKDI